MLQLVRQGLHQASLPRCVRERKQSRSRSIEASGLVSFATVCGLLLAVGLASACGVDTYGSETPETLALTTYTGIRAPEAHSSGQLLDRKSPTRLGFAAPTTAAPPAALRDIPATTSQVVFVTAPNASSTTAMIEAWERAGNGWRSILGPVPAHIGADGIGRASESTSRTPAGLFSLTQTFGRAANPGTRQPWFHATPTTGGSPMSARPPTTLTRRVPRVIAPSMKRQEKTSARPVPSTTTRW
jgi:hypothetical protein